MLIGWFAILARANVSPCIELAPLATSYILLSACDHHGPVKALSKDLLDQRSGRRVVATDASVGLL
jgi:hypothetical protein